jgi:hypothetical protein
VLEKRYFRLVSSYRRSRHLYHEGIHSEDLKVRLIPVEDIPPQAIKQLWPPK